MKLNGKKVLVVGTGISGVAAVKLLVSKGAKVVVLEGNTKLTMEDIRKRFPKNIPFDLIIGELQDEMLDKLDLAVLSPGVPIDLPIVEKMETKKIPVWGEIELAYACAKGKLLAITGTNGKTTTTALTGAIMKEYYKDVYVVGNIGLPYTEYAGKMTEDSVTVAEVSSFQLETIHDFHPNVSAILNITPDHLNRHHTMQCYIEMKARIAENQTKDEVCVLNYEDPELQKIAGKISASVFWFSSKRKLEKGIYLDGDNIIYKDGEENVVCSTKDLLLLGTHNYENVMAAVAIAVHAGVPMDCIRKAVCEFRAVEHRIEYVREFKGVKYYNDSKGTNPDAAIKAIQAMVSPTVLIGGGYDKQSTYEEWIDAFDGKVKALILMGETKDKIAETAKKAGFTNIIMVNDLKEAVETAEAQASEGDAVLLSPACASWDMFKSYEERGTLFKQYVNSLS